MAIRIQKAFRTAALGFIVGAAALVAAPAFATGGKGGHWGSSGKGSSSYGGSSSHGGSSGATPVPAPAAFGLFALGAVGLAAARRRKRS
jgi:MYXO-CTERM domain-containing protein